MSVNNNKRQQLMALILMNYHLEAKKKKIDEEKKPTERKKSSWRLNRQKKSSVNLLNELKLESEDDFRALIRMDVSTYEELLKLVTPIIKKRDSNVTISVEERLNATLRFLATPGSITNLQFETYIAPRTLSYIILETCKAIAHVLDDYIRLPTSEVEWRTIASDFRKKWDCPNCMGAMDGKHIAIVKPDSSGESYINYRGFHSVVLMALVVSRCQIIMADVGTNGRRSDSAVFANTAFNKAFKNGSLQILPPFLNTVRKLLILDLSLCMSAFGSSSRNFSNNFS